MCKRTWPINTILILILIWQTLWCHSNHCMCVIHRRGVTSSSWSSRSRSSPRSLVYQSMTGIPWSSATAELPGSSSRTATAKLHLGALVLWDWDPRAVHHSSWHSETCEFGEITSEIISLCNPCGKKELTRTFYINLPTVAKGLQYFTHVA